MAERIPKRCDVPSEYKWAIEDIYKDDAVWESDFQNAKGFVERIAEFKGQLSSARKLYEYMILEDKMTVTLDGLVNYAQRKSDEDTAKSEYQDMVARVEKLYVEISEAAAFVTPELLAIPDENMWGFYKTCPGLELYRRVIDNIRRKREHILSEAEERLMALTGEMAGSPDTIYSMFSDADLKFPDAGSADRKVE